MDIGRDIGREYERLLPDMLRIAHGLARGRAGLGHELAGVIGLAFMEATEAFDSGRGSYDRWILISVQNAVRDLKKYEARRLHGSLSESRLSAYTPHSPDIWLDLSPDAATLARWLLSWRRPFGNVSALRAAASELYGAMSWRRFWTAATELVAYLEPEPC